MTSFIFFALLSAHASAQTLPEACKRTGTDVLMALRDPNNQLSFDNDGGLFDGGVCWWHTRFTRSAAYLAEFHPELPKLSDDDAVNAIHAISELNEKVVIAGYANLKDFSTDYQQEIQSQLNKWQIRNGFLHAAWIQDLEGHDSAPPDQLHDMIYGIASQFDQEKRPLFLFLRLKGVTSHASLLIGYNFTSDGVALDVLDSNFTGTVTTFTYTEGMTSLDYHGTPYVPYVEFEDDFDQINGALQDACISS